MRMCCSKKIAIGAACLTGAILALGSTSVSARGAAANIMSSPGYQRALEESRKRQAEPYLKKPAVYPRKTWRKRDRRD